MNTVTKEEWADALRSGKFKQHHGTLSNAKVASQLSKATAFCCIGVLGVLAGITTSNEQDSAYKLAEELTGGRQGTLVNKNDTYRNTFEEIADYLDTLVV